jgi:hypothetical protein
MAKWFYYNENGEKTEVTGRQLKELAKSGQITPETMIETEEGKTAPARKVTGLTFASSEATPSESATVEPAQPDESGIYELASPPKPSPFTASMPAPEKPAVNPFTAAAPPPVPNDPFTAAPPIPNSPFTTAMPAPGNPSTPATPSATAPAKMNQPNAFVVGIVVFVVCAFLGWLIGQSGGGTSKQERRQPTQQSSPGFQMERCNTCQGTGRGTKEVKHEFGGVSWGNKSICHICNGSGRVFSR